MAKVNESLMKKWVDGETIHAVEYNNERDLIVQALNDTDQRVTDARAPFSVISNMIADGAVTESKITKAAVTQFTYDQAEIRQRIADAVVDGLPQEVIDDIVAGASETVAIHESNTDIHVTAVKQATWDAKETTTGAQTKADTAYNQAAAYTEARPWQKHKLSGDDGKCIALATGTDLNNLFSNGQYNGNGLINGPNNTDWFFIEVLNHTNGNTYCMQRASFLSGSANPTLFIRQCQGGVWGLWTVDVFASIAEVKQFGVDAKNGAVASLNAMGVAATTAETWASINAKIRQIQTGGMKNHINPGSLAVGVNTISNLAFSPKIISVYFYTQRPAGTNASGSPITISVQGYLIADYTGTSSYTSVNNLGSGTMPPDTHVAITNVVFGANYVTFTLEGATNFSGAVVIGE